MKRRSFLLASAALTAVPGLGLPALAQSGKTVLRYVPNAGLNNLDPMWTTADLVARDHGHMIYDTLFGSTEDFEASPQLAEGYEFNDESTECVITLRQQLVFHDNSPIRAQDCVASINRWMNANGSLVGQYINSLLESLTAEDDLTIKFVLARPLPMLVNLMSSIVAPVPFIMPERIAKEPPSADFSDTTGSGPFRFVAEEFKPGITAVYEKFEGYKPTSAPFEGLTSGPKIVHFDRVEWQAIPDSSTAFSALQAGEVDWVGRTQPELLEVARMVPELQVGKMEALPRIGTLRFNHLNTPFDNKKMRQALLPAIDQEDFGRASVGNDPEAYATDVGVFPPGAPMASDAGLEPLMGARDLKKAAQMVKEAGYDGETVRVLGPTNIPMLAAHAEVGIDMFRKIGLNVEPELVDWGTVVQKRVSKAPVSEGGWSAIFLVWPGATMLSPATNLMLQGSGEDAPFGWPDIPQLEELRVQWYEAETLDKQKEIAAEMQRVAMDELPFIPVSGIVQLTVLSAGLEDRVIGFPIFWNIKPAA